MQLAGLKALHAIFFIEQLILLGLVLLLAPATIARSMTLERLIGTPGTGHVFHLVTELTPLGVSVGVSVADGTAVGVALEGGDEPLRLSSEFDEDAANDPQE